MSDVISIRFTPAERDILNRFSELNGCGVSSFIKQIVFERLEDEFDMQTIADYELQKSRGTLHVMPIDTLWEELEL